MRKLEKDPRWSRGDSPFGHEDSEWTFEVQTTFIPPVVGTRTLGGRISRIEVREEDDKTGISFTQRSDTSMQDVLDLLTGKYLHRPTGFSCFLRSFVEEDGLVYELSKDGVEKRDPVEENNHLFNSYYASPGDIQPGELQMVAKSWKDLVYVFDNCHLKVNHTGGDPALFAHPFVYENEWLDFAESIESKDDFEIISRKNEYSMLCVAGGI